MLKNYIDGFFRSFIPNGYENIIEQSIFDFKCITENCNISAFTYFESLENYDNQTFLYNAIKHISLKSVHVIIFISETINSDYANFERMLHNEFSNLTILSEIVPNYPSKIKTQIAWFLLPTNLYAEMQWAKDQITNVEEHLYDQKPYLFDCLLGSQRLHRDFIEEKYKSSVYKDKIIFSYFKENLKNGIWDVNITNLKYSSDRIPVDGIVDVPLSSIIPVNVYNNSHYSIIAETSTTNNYNFYTEKIAKPLISKRPFVVFAGKNYLKNLKLLGFKTFNNIINESYDTIDNDYDRYEKAWAEVEKLTAHNPITVLKEIESILIHNQQHFISTDWYHEIKSLFLIMQEG